MVRPQRKTDAGGTRVASSAVAHLIVGHNLRRTHHRTVAICRLRQNKCGERGIPRGTLSSKRSRPHQVKHRRGMNFDFDRMPALNLISKNCACSIQRNKEPLADDEVRPQIRAGDRIWLVGNAAENVLSINRGCRPLLTKCDPIPAQNLEWIGPHFQAAHCVSVDRRPATVNRKEAMGRQRFSVEC